MVTTGQLVVITVWSRLGTAEVIRRLTGIHLLPGGRPAGIKTSLDKRADALDGAFEILRRYVRHVPDEKGQTLARLDKGQRIVGRLRFATTNQIPSG